MSRRGFLQMAGVLASSSLVGGNRRAASHWTINDVAYPMAGGMAPASFHLRQGRRYRVRMRDASDDVHPIHLHRHVFELTNVAGKATAGVMKDVVMVGGYQEVAFDFVADNPGMTLFHCHQQLHMDFGFMTCLTTCRRMKAAEIIMPQSTTARCSLAEYREPMV